MDILTPQKALRQAGFPYSVLPFQVALLLWINLHWQQNYEIAWCPFIVDVEIGDATISIGRGNRVSIRFRTDFYCQWKDGLYSDFDQYRIEQLIKHGYGITEPVPYELQPSPSADVPF